MIFLGALPGEDHCRVCYRLGDMVVCEICNGTYHFACLNPPLDDVPEYDWQCYICQENQIEGVNDCVDDQEKAGTKIRCLSKILFQIPPLSVHP